MNIPTDILQAKNLYVKAKEAYYNSGDPIMTDTEFDKLEDYLKEKCPKWPGLSKTGIKVGKKHAISLPYFMPSLNKYYPEHISKYWEKYSNVPKFLYMAKLDGCSVLLQYKDGNPISLITRGDGSYGKDISYFIPYLNLPRNIKDKSNIFLRCEAIVKKETFTIKWANDFQSNRNMVSGLLNRTDLHRALKDIDFVVLGIFDKNIVDGLKYAKSLGFNIVKASVGSFNKHKIFLEKVHQGKYEADGVVIAPTSFYYKYSNSDKPKDIVAYKENLETNAVDAQVTRIIYQVSHTGRIIPKVEIKPITLQGVTVKYVTCHNAQWMIDRKIGPKAVISVVRSGEVIPKIVGVKKEGELQYPSIPYKMDGVHFVCQESNDDQKIERIVHFIEVLGVKNVAKQTIITLYNNRINSITRLLKAIHNSKFPIFLQKHFGKVKGNNIFNSLHSIVLNHYTYIDVMVASGCFDAGINERKLQKIVDNGIDLSNIVNSRKEVIYNDLLGDSIKEKTAILLADGLNSFVKWWEKNSTYFDTIRNVSPKKVILGKFSGHRITFTGYRNKEQEDFLIKNGAEIVNFSTKTTVLLYKEDGKKSSKVEKAGSRAMTFEQFLERFA